MNGNVTSVIAGTEETGAAGGLLRSVNPAVTSEVVAEVALGNAKTFAAAARAARSAQASWSDVPAPVLDQFTRWQSMNWDYSGSLQKAQMDVAELIADVSFRLAD
jgi:DNA-binding NarL/FixJ family response regulator